MNKANPWVMAAVMFSLLCLGVWGCSHQKSGAFSAKIREMETRCAKLEEDYRAVAAAHEKSRKKLAQTETKLAEAQARSDELAKQIEELRPVVKERDDLRRQLASRTQERDQAQSQLVQFSRDLQALAGRVEAAALANPGPPLMTAIPASRKSE
jgi:outer membrane murein-binding lipoprotein Lpp